MLGKVAMHLGANHLEVERFPAQTAIAQSCDVDHGNQGKMRDQIKEWRSKADARADGTRRSDVVVCSCSRVMSVDRHALP